MADSPKDNPVRIVEQDGKESILVIPDQMVKWVWYKTKFDGKEFQFCKTPEQEILMRKS